jgi:exosortase E/protease (VPEID-CTERM system)
MRDDHVVTVEDRRRAATVYAGVIITLVAELCVILAVYRFDMFGAFDVTPASKFCASYVFADRVCHTLSGLPSSMLLLAFSLALISVILPRAERSTQRATRREAPTPPSSLLVLSNVAGLLCVVAPYAFVVTLDAPERSLLQLLWFVGAVLFATPIVMFLVSNLYILKRLKLQHVAVLLFAVVAPLVSSELDKHLWLETSLQHGTMVLVVELLHLLGQPTLYTPPETLGIQAFSVWIGFPCAGLSGILFSASLVSLFLMLSWHVIDFRRAIVLIPVAAVLSWLANSVRIAILLLIGEYISPQLAVEGFHSYAGWISIVLISSLTMYGAVKIQWFHREGVTIERSSRAAGGADAVYLLPFAVFMLTLLMASAFSNNPDALYPLRISVVTVSLIWFWRAIPSDLEFPDWKEIYALPAVALAAMWVWTGPSESKPLSEVLPNATDLEMLAWVAFRVAGTVLVVPIVEELFFRGYLLPKASTLLYNNHWAAVLLTSILFALLHSNIILAFAAGVLFGYVRIRTGRLVNAIACHALCNACIAAWALGVDNWAVI